MSFSTFVRKLVRKKVLSEEDVKNTNLKRCLTTVDLTGLGIGCTLGAGLYVVSGQVAHDKAGPAVIISFLVAAIASAFAGLCYAEFAARIPRAGSAYVYSYVTVGEFMAFVIGWNLVLEYVIGAASVARGWSGYFDSLIDYRISDFFNSTMHMDIPQLSAYPDFFAFGMTLLVTALLGFGVKESTLINNIFTVVNLMVVLYVTICGFFKIDWHNWNLSAEEAAGHGKGGFMPYGWSGMMAGAASCFYAFVGFDAVATTGEETKNPQKSIPIAIIISLFVIFLAYFFVSATITLMCPYYLLDNNAPLPAVFERVGWGVARYIISIGAIAGLSTSLLGGMLPLPRVLYAMGSDGVIFRFMGKVSPRFQTPVLGTAISGIFAGLMAMLFDLEELVNMMSIGTLLAYTLVAICVLILRYEPDTEQKEVVLTKNDYRDIRPLIGDSSFTWKALFVPLSSQATQLSSRITNISVAVMCLFVTIFCAFVIFCDTPLANKEAWAILIAAVLGLAIVVSVFIIYRQPQNATKLAFTVPFLPFLPALSSLVNIYLMLKLPAMTWLRFAIWMAIGFVVYFIAGVCYFDELKNIQGSESEVLTSLTKGSKVKNGTFSKSKEDSSI